MNWMLARQARFLVACFIVLVIAGGVSFIQLPVSLFPEINFPRIAISLEAGDRPADQMVTQITRPVEEALRSIPGVKNIRSQTSRGAAEISISLDWGGDISTAALRAESEISRLSPSLPSGLAFTVRRMDPTIFPVLGYSLTSTELSQVALKTFARFELQPILATIDGVAEVTVLGGNDAEYQVIVDPLRLQSVGLSITDIEAAIQADNKVEAVGRFEDRSRLYLSLVDGRLTTIADIGTIIVKAQNGTIIDLADVADIQLNTAQEWTRVTADGKTAVLVNIRQTPNANSIALTDSIKKLMAREAARFPSSIVITPYYDQSDLVRAAASSVRDSIIIGTILAGLVLFLFLRSIRMVLIVAVILPAVLVSTALLLNLLNLSLNIMTLGGMAAAVGLIVDDIVVMLEHISRRLSDKKISVLSAAAEMTSPLVGSSLATIIVFTPLAFLSGVTGGFFKALAITMASSLIFSMIYTVTICPLLATKLANENDAIRAENSNHWLDRIADAYENLMHRLLAHSRIWTISMIAVASIIAGLSSSFVSSGFMPQMDEGGLILDYVAPPGTSLTKTDQMVSKMEEFIRAVPEVESYSRRTGLQLGGGLSEANEGDMFIKLKPLPRRPIEEVMADIRQRVELNIPGLSIETLQLMGDIIGDLTAVPQPIEVKLYNSNPKSLAIAANTVMDTLQNISGVVEVQISDRISGDAIVVTLDRRRVALENMDPSQVTAQVKSLMNGSLTGEIQAGERSIGIKVWQAESMRQRISNLENTKVRSNDGHLIPLKRIASIDIIQGQSQISRENLQTMTAVTARLDGRDMGSAMKEITTKMQGIILPPGVRYEFGGLFLEQQKSFRDLIAVFIAAFILSGLLLLFLFKDFTQTASILGVVLLSVTGVLGGLVITGTELNIAALMGITMVIGIIAELGVFYFAELPDTDIEHAHRIAAGRARLRPIFMSASIAILALAPLALQFGQGSALLAPMAVAIISGLLVGAPLVLVAAPLLHSAMQIARNT